MDQRSIEITPAYVETLKRAQDLVRKHVVNTIEHGVLRVINEDPELYARHKREVPAGGAVLVTPGLATELKQCMMREPKVGASWTPCAAAAPASRRSDTAAPPTGAPWTATTAAAKEARRRAEDLLKRHVVKSIEQGIAEAIRRDPKLYELYRQEVDAATR